MEKYELLYKNLKSAIEREVLKAEKSEDPSEIKLKGILNFAVRMENSYEGMTTLNSKNKGA